MNVPIEALPIVSRSWIYLFREVAVELRDDLRQLARESRSSHEKEIASNVGGYHSPRTFFQQEHSAVSVLKCEVVRAVNSVCKANQVSFSTSETSVTGWINFSKAGDFHRPHHHGANSWSGVYYLDTGVDLGGEIVFYDPFLLFQKDGLSGDLEPLLVVKPQPCLLIVFPGFLPHAVLTYTGETERLSVAFNSYAVQ